MKRLLKQCRKELKRWRKFLQVMDHERLVVSALNMALYQIYLRNKDSTRSLKFSDYLKEEPYLDHYFYKVCRELDTRELNPRKRIYDRRKVKEFGVFNVNELEKKSPLPKLEIPVSEMPVEDFKEPFPWEIKLEND
jgi:hypothetical protein